MGVFEDFILMSWGVLVIVFFISSIYFLIQKQKAGEDPDRKRIMNLVFIMFLFIGVSRLIHLIAVINHGAFIGEFNFENELIFSFSELFLYAAIYTIILTFERRIKRTERPYYTITVIFTSIPYVVMRYILLFNQNDTTIDQITLVCSLTMNIVISLFVLALSFMYLKISFKTSGDVRKRSLFVFLGFILLFIGYGVNLLENFGMGRDILAIVSFFLSITSIPFLILGYKKTTS